MARLFYILFFVSGLAGLVYETIWSRYLALFVGHSAYAQVIVLTIFLGGLSLGALLVGQVTERIRRPLLAYAGVEAVVGVMGLLFHLVYTSVTELAYQELLPGAAPGSAPAIRWALSAGMILPPSILLGTTFPLMSAALLRRDPARPGRTLALLYFSNSLGAALGAVLTGFVLIAVAGLPGTVAFAGALNLAVAAGAWALHRRTTGDEALARPAAVQVPAPAEATAELPETPGLLWRGLLVVAFGTAVASFIYEIAWIRMLSLVLGSATHAFELMLSAFILGIALGALWIETRLDRLEQPLGALAVVQWLMGFAALATLPLYVASFGWTASLIGWLEPSETGYRLFNLGRYGLALLIMLPSTFCAGMTLPLLTRILVVSGPGERAVGWVYGVNTLGSIVGVSLAALLLLPLMGVRNLLLLGAGLDMALGAWVLFLRPSTGERWVRARRLAVGGTVVVVAGFGMVATLDPLVLTSGVFRDGTFLPRDSELLYYQDGRTATVSVVDSRGLRIISTNGKADASVRQELLRSDTISEPMAWFGDEPTQLLVGLLPLAYRPQAREAALVGHGSGLTSHYLLGSPELESLLTIEIERAMIEGSRAYYPANRRVFDDPRASFVIEDARSVLEAYPGELDIIISEPSNPWVSGVSSLFTVEFYERVRSRLAPDGIFVQWMQIYEISDDLVLSVLKSLHEVFPSYRIYRSTGDLIVVANDEESLQEPDWSILDWPGVQEDIASIRGLRPTFLEQLEVASRGSLGPLLDQWSVVNSDFDPVLDLGADKARFIGDWASAFLFLGTGPLRVDIPYHRPIRNLATASAPFPQIRRLEGLALNRSLREAVAGRSLESLDAGDQLAENFYQVRRFRSAMASGQAPSDWLRWSREAVRFLELFHEGLIGVADEGIYAELEAYARDSGAPEPVLEALAFSRHGYAWEFEEAVASGELLLRELEAGRQWVDPQRLLDALITAQLQTGRGAEAAATYQRLQPHARRAPDDLRTRLLEAHLGTAGAERP